MTTAMAAAVAVQVGWLAYLSLCLRAEGGPVSRRVLERRLGSAAIVFVVSVSVMVSILIAGAWSLCS